MRGPRLPEALMRVAIVYPPFRKGARRPLLGQNRQFRYSNNDEVKIFPLIPASCATILKKSGHEVLFLDAMNTDIGERRFNETLSNFAPDVVVLETKAPVVKRHWEFINELKARKDCVVILVGDHVTYFPEESLSNSKVDYIVGGGDYDVAVNKLVDYLSGRQKGMPKGVSYRDGLEFKSTGPFELVENLDELPFIDRELTRWQDYGEAYLKRPCAYILSGRGCGGNGVSIGACFFCIWQHSLWKKTARLRSPANVAAEIKMLVDEYGVKEVFDDNEGGPVWDIEWLREFHRIMKAEGLIGRVILSTNARADALTPEVCKLLQETGYRLLKVGLETGSDAILKKLNKNETTEDILKGVKTAKDFGLRVLLTSMVGYPWETEEEVRKTFELAKKLMLYKTHAGDSLQASVVVPYPGTPLYKLFEKGGYFLFNPAEYEKYDMTAPVVKTQINAPEWCARMWKIHLHPKFVLRSLVTSRSINDLKLLGNGLRSLLGHIKDFSGKKKAVDNENCGC